MRTRKRFHPTRPARRRAEAASSTPRPRKSLGQHFLQDEDVLTAIASALGPPAIPVIEVGPGTGQLTAALLAAGHEVIAVELDERLLRHLRERFAGAGSLTLVSGDAREIEADDLVPSGTEFVVTGNLPYFAASYIIRHFLESSRPPRELVVMVQREVAREFAAAGKLSLLAIGVQVFAEAEILLDVPPEAFEPPPAVWSSVVRLTVRGEPLVPRERLERFFRRVGLVFRNPRKQIRNALGLDRASATAVLAAAGVDPQRRPETLSIEEWLELVDVLERHYRER